MTNLNELLRKRAIIQKKLDEIQYDQATLRCEMDEIAYAIREIEGDTGGWWFEEEKAYCPKCGVQHSMVRPGKTQPNCECDSICDCGGRITYHHEPDIRWPNVSGYFCEACGPFGFEL